MKTSRSTNKTNKTKKRSAAGHSRHRAPVAGRPHMPGYGIAESARGMLPWKWAVRRLAAGHNYWISTTRPDGRPHAMAVWGVWMDDAFYFSTGDRSRKARNLAANPACVVHPERGDEAVIVEGLAELLPAGPVFERFRKAYKKKYDFDPVDAPGIVYAVRPRVVFGFIEKESKFTTAATRWVFRLKD